MSTIVPIDLGGSPTRCALSPPRRAPPTPELVAAMIEHYRAERAPAGEPVEVAFYRGGVPRSDLLAAAAPWPVRVACSPADLSRADAARLLAAGVRTIELEIVTFDEAALRACRRGYRGELAALMLRELGAAGVRRGAILAPGTPGSSHDTAVADARRVADEGLAEFARLQPALALAGSDLERLLAEGRWRPMRLGEAVTTLLAMVEILEPAGVELARIGLQPGQDVPDKVVAGPYHPSLRHLVEVRRFYARMEALLRLVPSGSRVELQVNPRDLSWARGTGNENVRALRARLGLRELAVSPDAAVERGEVRLARLV